MRWLSALLPRVALESLSHIDLGKLPDKLFNIGGERKGLCSVLFAFVLCRHRLSCHLSLSHFRDTKSDEKSDSPKVSLTNRQARGEALRVRLCKNIGEMKRMIVDLPHDVQQHVFDMYKADLKDRYECSLYYLLDVVRAACGEKADAVLQYMAQMVQQSNRKPHFAIVLTEEFADMISAIMCKVAGEGNWTSGDARVMLGRFNGHMREKKLVIIRGPIDYHAVGSLKEILTRPSIVIEERHQNAVCIPSHHRVVLINQVEIRDGARRFCAVECDNVSGFRPEVLERQDVVAGFVRYLSAV